MFRYELSYNKLLQKAGLERLSQRRDCSILKFAQKAAENPIYADLFPKSTNRTTARNPKIFEEKFARSDRCYKSPVYTMLRMLNNTHTTI